MKNRFAQILSILCALILVMNAVYVLAEDAPATPTDLEPQTQQEEIIPAEEEETQPEEEEPETVLPEDSVSDDETVSEETKPEEQPAEQDEEIQEEQQLPEEEATGEPEVQELQEDQDKPVESVEVIVTKVLKMGDTWEGITKDTKPVLLKLDVAKSQTVHLLVNGKKVVWATVAKSDRPEATPRTVLSDPDTKRLHISFEAEKGSYLIQIGPEAPNRNALITVNMMDDESYSIWTETLVNEMEQIGEAEDQEEIPGKQETMTEPEADTEKLQETESHISEEEQQQESGQDEIIPDEPKETAEEGISETDPVPEQESQTEEETENEPKSDLQGDRTVDFEFQWDTRNPKVGDTVHFKAILSGYDNTDYTLQWQYSSDCELWTDYPDAIQDTLDVKVTKELDNHYWRLVVYIEETQEN